MTQPTFMLGCRTEWQRLNTTGLSEAEGLFPTFKAAFREAWADHFAALRVVWRLVAQSGRRG